MKPFVFLKNACFGLLPLAMICLCGCENGAETPFTPVLDDTYSTNATMTYGEDAEAKLLLTRHGEGIWEATFAEPATLAGVSLAFDGGAVSASYKGLAFTVPKTAMPAKAMLVLLTDVLDALDAADTIPATVQDDQSWQVSGESGGGSYTITFDPAGHLQAFEVPSQPLTVAFTDYVVNASSTEPSVTGMDGTSAPSTSGTSSATTGNSTTST